MKLLIVLMYQICLDLIKKIKEDFNMKEITKAKLEEFLDEMTDEELSNFIMNQFLVLEEAFNNMCYRNFSYKVKNKMLKNDQCYAQKFNKEVLMQSQKIIFKNKLDIEVFDKNFYNIIFERLLSLHKKS